MFSTQSENCSPFLNIFYIISLFPAELEGPKIGIRGKGLITLMKKALENTVGKGENAGNQHFLLFLLCFLLNQREKLSFLATFNLLYASAFNLVTSKILLFGKELIMT